MSFMKSLIKNLWTLAIVSLPLVFNACTPENSDLELDNLLKESELEFSVSQNPAYDNEVYLESRTPQAIPFWDYGIGISNKMQDTIILPFGGIHTIKYSAYGGGGATTTSVEVTVSANDPVFFSDPKWNLLTNADQGKSWKVAGVYVGPQSDYTQNWWQPDVSGDPYFDDIVIFDLNGGYHFQTDNQDGLITTGNFVLDIESNYLRLVGGQMPVQDWGGDGISVTRYKIVALTEDMMILGQGAEFIPGRESEDWSWYTIYESVQ